MLWNKNLIHRSSFFTSLGHGSTFLPPLIHHVSAFDLISSTPLTSKRLNWALLSSLPFSCVHFLSLSIKFNFIYIVSVSIQMISRCFTETRPSKRQWQKKKTCLLTRRNLEQNQAHIGRPSCWRSVLQLLQNSAAPVLMKTRRQVYISLVPKSLHWLPACFRLFLCSFYCFLNVLWVLELFTFQNCFCHTNPQGPWDLLPLVFW